MSFNNTKANKAEEVKYWLSGLTVAFGIIAAVLANKMVDVGIGFSWIVPAAVVAYMGCVAVDNITSEVFGWKQAKIHTWITFVAEAAMVILFTMGLALKPAPWVDGAAWNYVLGNTWRCVVASLLAYVVSSFVNSYIINQMKMATIKKYGDTNKFMGLRTCGSTLIAQLIDATMFITIAFAGTPNFSVGGIFRQWVVKLIIAVIWVFIETPIIKKIKEATGCDAVVEDVKDLKVF